MKYIVLVAMTLYSAVCISLVYSQEKKVMKEAYFAGGCFWCMEPPFEVLDGVSQVVSGYTGGKEIDPSYQQVASGITGHYEAVTVIYDETKISYEELLQVFWRQIDPTDRKGQFVDRGRQYATAIFYSTEEERKLAEESKQFLQTSGWFNAPIVTEIIPFEKFYIAEEYHQDYYKKSKFRYKFYRAGSGRDQFLSDIWGDEMDDTDEIPKKQ